MDFHTIWSRFLSALGPSQPRSRRILSYAALACGAVFVLGLAVLTFYYVKYKHIVDESLEKPLFANTAKIYAAPREVRPGQKLSAGFLAQELREAGYTEEGHGAPSPMGTYSFGDNSISVRPGPQSFHAPESATISFKGQYVSRIASADGRQTGAYDLEPVLITGLSDENRAKRRLVTYGELPRYLVPAVTSIEDRRFFEHGGVDYLRLVGAFRNDLTHRHTYMEGGSTLTMQLARGFFLTPEKRLKRKFIEILITYQLEDHFDKKKIFELYANQIPLGQRGSFAIHGFGEASRAYFGKDIRQLNLPECALLAGLIQSPSRLNPYRHPKRARERRNLVLDEMVETKAITREQADAAKATQLNLSTQSIDSREAPYFVDLVRDKLTRRLGDSAWTQEGLRVYTSLDPELQAAATQAIDEGMKKVDELVRRRYERKGKKGDAPENITYPQVALVALNPHTGQVLALSGGRSYGMSQLNRAVAHRPTGSIFKPFVYAAAFSSSLNGTQLTDADGHSSVFTPVTMLDDEPTTYTVGDQEYTPRNFEGKYHDEVTARFALQQSLNNATIALGQMVGFGNVAALARSAGITSARGTPSVAIGAYDATPLEMAGAYTIFANDGLRMDPWLVDSVRGSTGDVIADFTHEKKQVLDPRAAYLTTDLMENVINHGTGYAVRALGFSAPAAGKTGTSHDAWFAGFTSNLLCIVWVGNDDYTDIKMEGAHAAAPIWAEFMKRAIALPQYSDAHDFVPPVGVVQVQLDSNTNLLASLSCPQDYTAAFLEGTQPSSSCDQLKGDHRNFFEKLFGLGEKPQVPVHSPAAASKSMTPQNATSRIAAPRIAPTRSTPNGGQPIVPGEAYAAPPPEKKRGFFKRLFGIGKKDEPQEQKP
jgi:penicillin-binding protein 1B